MLDVKTYKHLRYYHTNLDIKHGIFTRRGGVSLAPFDSLNLGGTVGDAPEAVKKNHHLMYEALDVNASRAVTSWLVHSCDVVVAERPIEGQTWLAKADAIITNTPDLPLVMRYADCTPLLFHDPIKGAIGIAHAGWRGTVQGMASATIRAMIEAFDCEPAHIRAVIGPSISLSHFQVGEEVVEAFQESFGTLEGILQRDPDDNTAYIDLWEANRRDLMSAGVQDIETMRLCTFDGVNEFYSHRAEKGRTGRFGAVISL